MAGILILFPMHYRGAVLSSLWRVVGVVQACLYILLVQLLIYDFSNHMLLMMPLIGLGLAFSARLHVMEKSARGGFCQYHHHRDYVRPEPASGQRSGVQRFIPHHLCYRRAGGNANDGISGTPGFELLYRDAVCDYRVSGE